MSAEFDTIDSVYSIREAIPGDLEVIVAFNEGLARETEAKSLDRAVLTEGVRAALADTNRLRYWVAVLETGQVIGQAAISREWSDWRNGWLWWFQSVYVDPDMRGRGVFRALHTHIRQTAQAEGNVIGLRLYVEHNNAPAQTTYRTLGMLPGGYEVFEEIWVDLFREEPRREPH